MDDPLSFIKGGITAAPGIFASGISCGIKDRGLKDLALVQSVPPATAAGVFTSNLVASPSVLVCKENLSQSSRARAIIINSGNANAGTGEKGRKDATEVTRLLGLELGLPPESVLLASTGVIGVLLPMDRIKAGLSGLVKKLSSDGGRDAAEAIMTTDTKPKEFAVEYEHGGHKITVGGMAKGSGMIQPDMATMLAFLSTDIRITKPLLQRVLRKSVDATFNRITVDGETSTNDTALCLANGLAGNQEITEEGEALTAFRQALETVCLELAKAIVRDGEGATKFIEMTVAGAETDAGAYRIAKKIANSLLVKTAFFGQDPNWGRIISAAGSAGVPFAPTESELSLGGVRVMAGASPVPGYNRELLKEIMGGREIACLLKVGQGPGRATVFTTDLSYGYVKINAEYTS